MDAFIPVLGHALKMFQFNFLNRHGYISTVVLLLIFKFPFRFGFNSHGLVPALIALRFDLAAPTRPIAFLFFASNMLVKRHSYFLALGFLTGVGVMGNMGLLLVIPSLLETIVASRIYFNCCLS